ncbi:MAG: glycosyltransferase family 39 protein, partial [Chloroflexi bacterium]|nr:glycosyltransferase family 39 protein [Chloroflexota bacterium]
REVYTFSEGVMAHLLHKYNTDSPLVVFLTQVKLSLLMFHHSGDTSTQFGFPRPMFNSIVSPLIALGLAAALRRWKNAGAAFVLVWLAIIFALGSVLTIDAPFWPRLVGIVPAAAFLIAVALEQIRELVVRLFGVRYAGLTAALIALFIAFSGYNTWNAYYLFVKNSASPSTLTGRYISMLPPEVVACGITDPPLKVRETSFLAWPHKLVDISPDAPDSDLEKCGGDSIVWAISPQYIDRLDAVRARWPQGILDQRYMERFDYTMTFYLVNVEPPQFERKEALDLLPSLLKFLGVLLPIALAGLLVWLFFRDAILDFWRGQAAKRIAAPSIEPPALELKKTVAQPGGWRQKLQEVLRLPSFTPALLVALLSPFLAVGLAYFGQTFLDQSSPVRSFLRIEFLYNQPLGTRQWIAVSLFIFAAAFWTAATAASANFTPPGETRREQNLQPVSGSPLHIAAVFFGLSAVLLYAFNGETALTRWLWFAGLFLFLLSLFFKRRFEGAVSREESPPFRWFHALTLSLLLALAFAMRVYRLYDIPLDLSTDMASVGIHARNYLLGVEKDLFGTGWYFMPRMSFIPYAASMAVAGNNLFGLYFAVVVMGTLNILGIYLFVWRLFDRHRLALLTAVLVVVNPAHIHFSRITSYVDPWFLGFFGLFFLVDGLKGRRWASFALAGVFAGFTLISYPAGRAIVPLIVLALACAWLLRRDWVIENYRGLGWLALGAFFALGPNLIYFVTDWSVYMQRSSQVLIFNPGVTQHLMRTYEVDSIWKILWEQTRRSVLMFNYYSDLSAQFFYPHPMFNSIVSPLLALGFGMSLYRWRKPQFLFLTSSFLFLLVTGAILTDNAPTWCRLVGMIPLAALFIALTLDEFAILFERLSLKIAFPLWALTSALLLGWLAVTDWNAYFDYAGNEEIVRPEVHVARYLDALPDDIDVCGMTYEFDYLVSQEEIQFMGWPRSITVVPVETAVLTPDLCPARNVVWILSPIYEDRLAEIQALWRGGTVERHKTKNDWHIFTSYMVLSR